MSLLGLSLDSKNNSQCLTSQPISVAYTWNLHLLKYRFSYLFTSYNYLQISCYNFINDLCLKIRDTEGKVPLNFSELHLQNRTLILNNILPLAKESWAV